MTDGDMEMEVGVVSILGGTFNLDTLFNTLRATSGSRNINYRRLQEGRLPIYHAMHTECENHYERLHSEIMGWRTPRVPLFEEYRKRSKGMIRYVKGGYVANSASSYVSLVTGMGETFS